MAGSGSTQEFDISSGFAAAAVSSSRFEVGRFFGFRLHEQDVTVLADGVGRLDVDRDLFRPAGIRRRQRRRFTVLVDLRQTRFARCARQQFEGLAVLLEVLFDGRVVEGIDDRDRLRARSRGCCQPIRAPQILGGQSVAAFLERVLVRAFAFGPGFGVACANRGPDAARRPPSPCAGGDRNDPRGQAPGAADRRRARVSERVFGGRDRARSRASRPSEGSRRRPAREGGQHTQQAERKPTAGRHPRGWCNQFRHPQRRPPTTHRGYLLRRGPSNAATGPRQTLMGDVAWWSLAPGYGPQDPRTSPGPARRCSAGAWAREVR